MRWSRFFLHTARTAPGEVAGAARRLLARAGAIDRLPGGATAYLPLGLRSLRRLEARVRRELAAAGGIEVSLPPGPARGDGLAELARGAVRSYRRLPLHLFHLGGDAGAGDRGTERVLAAASFHASAESASETARAVADAFRRLFEAGRIDAAAVAAGGGATAFVAPSEDGDDEVLRDPGTGRQAVAAAATCAPLEPPPPLETDRVSEVATPGAHTVADVARLLGVDPQNVVKTLLYESDRGPVAALVRGDREVEEGKLRAVVGAAWIELAREEEIRRLTGAPVGFAGPAGLPGEVLVVADRSLEPLTGFVCGANRADVHLVGARLGRDLPLPAFHDLLRVRAGDPSPGGGGALEAWRGVELGRVGVARVPSASALAFTDETGAERPVLSARHGLDLDRTLAAVVERGRDEAGIVWPRALAPFEVLLVALQPADEAVRAEADRIYRELRERGTDVLYDDRDERPGSKFHDADLVGIPVRVVVGGRSLAEGRVELSRRRDREVVPVDRAEAVGRALELLGG